MATLRKELIVHRDPEILGGISVFVGTRVPARILFEHLEAGDSLEVFLKQFPSVSREQAIAAVDITERKLAEDALRESGARLETLTRRLLEVQESERRMVARELHDEVGGVLTAVKLNLQAHGRGG